MKLLKNKALMVPVNVVSAMNIVLVALKLLGIGTIGSCSWLVVLAPVMCSFTYVVGLALIDNLRGEPT